jgi:hypothetical protein|tara:strand:- start:1536 stop:1772 length:237 start_codon:yes stop_codon:yes gene_type:complete
MNQFIEKIIEKIHCKIESYFCWHGLYSKWVDGAYGEYYETDPSCWICNTRRGKVYLYFHYKFEYLHELVSMWEVKSNG